MGLKNVTYRTQYRTGDDDLIEEFYLPSLRHAELYERAVGYFRSSVYLMVGEPTIDFAMRGGQIRLLCSPSLTEEDIQSIRRGYAERASLARDSLLGDIELLLKSDETAYRTRVLGTLIASGSLDVRLAVRPSASGIFH